MKRALGPPAALKRVPRRGPATTYFPTRHQPAHIVHVRLTFRHRVFLGLVALGTLPLAAALLVFGLYLRSAGPEAGFRTALDEIAASGGELVAGLDSARLDDSTWAAVERHAALIARETMLARRSELLARSAVGALGLAVLVGAAALAVLSVALVRHWSAQVSAPIEELVDWVRRIQRGDSLPDTAERRVGGPPELDALRHALRDMATALEEARIRELERERLSVYRETARRVAHEMRGPLNAAQLALRRLSGVAGDERHASAVAVLAEETERLRRLGDEFATFGRLPEGPHSVIDLSELVEGVLAAAVPTDCPVMRSLTPGLMLRGRHEALRRAVENVVRNAVDVTDARGIAIGTEQGDGVIRLHVTDHGPGVRPEDRRRIFQPYVTTKRRGTGLGLAIAHEAVAAHGGALTVDDGPDGGARFTLTFPGA